MAQMPLIVSHQPYLLVMKKTETLIKKIYHNSYFRQRADCGQQSLPGFVENAKQMQRAIDDFFNGRADTRFAVFEEDWCFREKQWGEQLVHARFRRAQCLRSARPLDVEFGAARASE